MRVSLLLLLTISPPGIAATHPPLRPAPGPTGRPADKGPVFHVDPVKGDDAHPGTEAAPWRTLDHAILRLQPGQTLYLHEGVHRGEVYLALAGRADAPITIRSAPGERAIIDASIPEFFEQPTEAWELNPEGAPGEYRSVRAYPNLRDVIGSFGDSMIGLQTYYHAIDLRATNELADFEDPARRDQTDLKPLYLGPGLWYDQQTGRIHCRLAHTHLPAPVPNYRGETDPRKVPLIIAPFASIPLRLDGAKHIRIQDLTIRGAGYTSVQLEQADHVSLDNVLVWCGTYGLRPTGTQHLTVTRCRFHGSLAPWTFRADASKRDYPGRPHRNISRLNTHALIEIEAGRESSVYAFPQNDFFEFANCQFTDAHDGVYLGGINASFHHNLIDNLQDDGVYLSPMYLRHRLENKDPEIRIYENEFRTMLTALAFGGTESTGDKVYIYRNLFDLRGDVLTGRPSSAKPDATLSTGKIIGDHGSPPWSAMNIYHNTFVMAAVSRDAAMGTLGSNKAGFERRVFNNIYLHLGGRLPNYPPPDPTVNVIADGNLFWAPGVPEKTAATFFDKFRKSPAFAESQKRYEPGSSTNSRVIDPKLGNDWRPASGSPVANAGVAIPADWPDTLREKDRGKPDIGALPVGYDGPLPGLQQVEAKR